MRDLLFSQRQMLRSVGQRNGASALLLAFLLLPIFKQSFFINALVQPPITHSSVINLSPTGNSTNAVYPHDPTFSCPVRIPWGVCRRVSHRRFKFLHKVEEEICLVYTDQRLSLVKNERYILSFYTIPALRRVSIMGVDPVWTGPENITQRFDSQDGTLLFEPPTNGPIRMELHLEESSDWWIRGDLDLFKLGP